MIKESARVIRVADGLAWVKAHPDGACGACRRSEGCGVISLSRFFGARAQPFRALNRIGAEVGEEVTIGIREDVLMWASLFVYLAPLIGMIGLGLVASVWLGAGVNNELPVIGTSVLGLALGFAAVVLWNRRAAGNPRFIPVVLQRRRVDQTPR